MLFKTVDLGSGVSCTLYLSVLTLKFQILLSTGKLPQVSFNGK